MDPLPWHVRTRYQTRYVLARTSVHSRTYTTTFTFLLPYQCGVKCYRHVITLLANVTYLSAMPLTIFLIYETQFWFFSLQFFHFYYFKYFLNCSLLFFCDADVPLQLAIANLKFKFLSSTEALLHGDLHRYMLAWGITSLRYPLISTVPVPYIEFYSLSHHHHPSHHHPSHHHPSHHDPCLHPPLHRSSNQWVSDGLWRSYLDHWSGIRVLRSHVRYITYC